MSFLQRVLSFGQGQNLQLNHIACIENDYSGKSCDQLLALLQQETDPDKIVGIKKLLVSRGYSKKELQQLCSTTQH